MADPWKGLATTAMSELCQASVQPLGPSFAPAQCALSAREVEISTLARGYVVPEIDLVGPTANLEQASRAIARYTELHNRVVRVFSIYGGVLGALTDGPLWQGLLALPAGNPDALWLSWVERRAHALLRVDQASERLRSVQAYDLATVDAFNVALSFPDNPQAGNAWMRAAENLAERADAAARAVSSSEVTMYQAVSRENNCGVAILNR